MAWISGEQQQRDHNGMRNDCAVCGWEGTKQNPLEIDETGMRVHSDAFHDRMRYRSMARTELAEQARERAGQGTTTPGGTGMGIDDIRSAIAAAVQEGTQITGVVHQVTQDLNQLLSTLAQACAGSERTDVIDALAALGQAQELFWQANDLVRSGITAAESYAQGL